MSSSYTEEAARRVLKARLKASTAGMASVEVRDEVSKTLGPKDAADPRQLLDLVEALADLAVRVVEKAGVRSLAGEQLGIPRHR